MEKHFESWHCIYKIKSTGEQICLPWYDSNTDYELLAIVNVFKKY